MQISSVIQLEDGSRVAEARRAAVSVAECEGLDQTLISNSAIIATELATNLVKHATLGEIHVLPLSGRGLQGVEILSIDHGPGLADIQQCLIDGYSTGGTSGTGLGAIRRLASQLDFYSSPGMGTVIAARLFAEESSAAPDYVFGVAAKPLSGEPVSGDAWSLRFERNSILMIVADGLGHGMLAAEASSEAIRSFSKAPEESPLELLRRIHVALRGSRGAAVSIAKIEFDQHRVLFAGLGNVAGVIISPNSLPAPKLQSMISYNGTAGHEARQMKEFAYPFGGDDIIVMHSDGLSSHWNLQNNPGILSKHPALIAGTLYRDCARHRDDVCVLVGKKR